MSWKFPKYPVKNTQVIDLEDVNANFREFADELAGQLNEHNWKEGAISATTSLEKDAAYCWHSAGAHCVTASSPGWPTPVTSGSPKMQLITARPVWTPLDNVTLTFTSPGCLLWIHGSAQLNQAPVDSGSGLPSYTGTIWDSDYFVRLQLAIRIDNYVIPESIIGGVEVDNDRPAGMKQPMMPIVTSIAFPLAAGQHTVELVARTTGVVLEKGGTTQDTSPLGFYASCRELMALEIRR
jgi:hypothetical protein